MAITQNDILRRKQREDALDRAESEESTSGVTSLPFQGEYKRFKEAKISIKALLLNSENRRTRAQRKKWCKQKNIDFSFWDSGNYDKVEVQDALDEIIFLFFNSAQEKKIIGNLKSDGQQEPLIVDHKGVVWSGNRRLTYMRKLLKDDPEKYGKFSNINIIRLPECQKQDLVTMETKLEIVEDVKSPHSWIDQYYGLREDVDDPDLDMEIITAAYKVRQIDVEKMILQINLVDRFLKKVDDEFNYDNPNIDFQVFDEFSKKYKKVKEEKTHMLDYFEKSAIEIIKVPAPTGKRKYTGIKVLYDGLETLYKRATGDSNTGGVKGPFGGPSSPIPPPASPDEVEAAGEEAKEKERERKKKEKFMEKIIEAEKSLKYALDSYNYKSKRKDFDSHMDSIVEIIKDIQGKVKRVRE